MAFHKIISRFSKSPNHNVGINLHYLKQFLPEAPTIVESGAHYGQDTIQMAKLWKKAKIFAFEPVTRIYKILKHNTRKYHNVTCISAALSNIDGESFINISSGSSDGSSSLLEPQDHLSFHPTVQFLEREKTKTFTLDSWSSSYEIQKVDLLWFDMQGNEFNALNSGQNILQTVSAIYTEVNLIPLYKNCILYPDLKKWLELQDFIVKKEFIYWNDAGNVLFTRK